LVEASYTAKSEKDCYTSGICDRSEPVRAIFCNITVGGAGLWHFCVRCCYGSSCSLCERFCALLICYIPVC